MNVGSPAVWAQHIFNVKPEAFTALAQDIFRIQWANNAVFRAFGQSMGLSGDAPSSLTAFPFLPISFFKTHEVRAFTGEPSMVFTSSGTTGSQTSRHGVYSLDLYEEAFTRGFHHFYGEPANYGFLCLLPSYLERAGSSLIYMAEKLISQSGDRDSAFFLHNQAQLAECLIRREAAGKASLLLGVTFALLDFADQFPMPLRHTLVMETGGMKGRRKEIVRAEVHSRLKEAFDLPAVHAEYGMTELMSQAYASADGRFRCPPWMKVLVRDEDDPVARREMGTGLLCIIDLANVYSCAFIETADLGRVYPDGSFEVLGRLDNSDIRGCSLLAV